VLLYLDLHCFNRPFDDQSQARIAQETAAVFATLQRIIHGIARLVWSDILTFENAQHPLVDGRVEIAQWAHRAIVHMAMTPIIAARVHALASTGFRALDVAHLACAEAANCDRVLTCDDQMLRTARRVLVAVPVHNPVTYIEEVPDG
jgi:predicted nucleic acid-binding protein